MSILRDVFNKHSHIVDVQSSKRYEIGRDTVTNLTVLTEHDWRFSVVEGDNFIVPKTPQN